MAKARTILLIAVLCGLCALCACWPANAQQTLRWGADPSGGAPYVFTDPANPDRYIGYEKEMVDALAAAMGRRAEFVPSDWETLVSALQRKSFELCGEVADGAISWVCPGVYLRDVALPAMRIGADKAGRPIPPLMAHAPICVHDKPDEVREVARQQLANYVRLPFYVQMLIAAGFPEASQGAWSDRMIDT